MSVNPTAPFDADKVLGPTFTPMFAVRNVVRFLELTGLMVFASSSDLMTLEEAAEYRGVTATCLGQQIKSGVLPSAPVYSRNRKKPHIILVRKQDIDALPPVARSNARKFRKAAAKPER